MRRTRPRAMNIFPVITILRCSFTNICISIATISQKVCQTRNFSPDRATSPKAPETCLCGLALLTQVREQKRRCRQTSPKPAENLPRRTWPRSEDQEDLDRRRIVSGSQVEPCRPPNWHGLHLPVSTRTPCDFSATPGALATSLHVLHACTRSVPSTLFSPCLSL